MTKAERNTDSTAEETYAQRREDIARVMDWLELELDKHRVLADGNPTNWGYAGDLGSVRARLIEALAYLSGNETDQIEHLLSESR